MMLATEPESRRARRTKSQMQDIREGLYAILEADNPMSVRQVFYQAVTRGLVDKTELAYKTTSAACW